ncbi:MAG: hypothetical protein ACM3YE_02805, partial [Bacteroidota bacterium]
GLLLTLTLAVSADNGFRASLGYEDLNNELTLSANGVTFEVNSPCPMFFVEAGYDFSAGFAIDAKYSKCVEDQTLVALESSILGAEIATDSDTDLFSIEASYKKQLGVVQLKGIAGHLESDFERVLSGRIFESSGAIELEQSVSGAYLGGEISYLPSDRFQVGAAYRWMIDPDIDLKVAGCSLDVSDPESSQLEVFAQTALTEKLSLKASYSISWVEYDLSELNVENKTDGLTLKLQYQF